MTIRAAVFEVLDNIGKRDISGWQLFDMALLKTGRHTYPTVLIKYGRDWASISGGGFDCIDPVHSVYRVTPGAAKISGAIVD